MDIFLCLCISYIDNATHQYTNTALFQLSWAQGHLCTNDIATLEVNFGASHISTWIHLLLVVQQSDFDSWTQGHLFINDIATLEVNFGASHILTWIHLTFNPFFSSDFFERFVLHLSKKFVSSPNLLNIAKHNLHLKMKLFNSGSNLPFFSASIRTF